MKLLQKMRMIFDEKENESKQMFDLCASEPIMKFSESDSVREETFCCSTHYIKIFSVETKSNHRKTLGKSFSSPAGLLLHFS